MTDTANSDPHPAFPDPLLRFVELFDRQEFWESHEVLEAAWRESRSGFYHGLILYASAFVHAQRGNPRGVLAQLRKSERALEPYAPAYLGVDVDGILREIDDIRARVERVDAGIPAGRVPAIGFPRLRLDPARILGSEAELT